jgi:hypothetical protein
MDSLQQFIFDISNKKFAIRVKRCLFIYTEKIKIHPEYSNLLAFLNEKYVIEGYGIKSLISTFSLPISYSGLRSLITFMNISIHTPNVANEFLCSRRKINAQLQVKNKTGMYSYAVQDANQHKKSNRGIQGYYWNTSKNKYVWLRSSWEFIYAKWLNARDIIWDVECESYILNDGSGFSRYRPDFFIYKNDKLISIIEVKGYWKDKVYKFDNLKKILTDIDMILITDIVPYTEQNLNKEIDLWKKLRKSKLEKSML